MLAICEKQPRVRLFQAAGSGTPFPGLDARYLARVRTPWNLVMSGSGNKGLS
jgi:hypothetical protein